MIAFSKEILYCKNLGGNKEKPYHILISLEMAETLKLFIMVYHDAGKIFYYHGVIHIYWDYK